MTSSRKTSASETLPVSLPAVTVLPPRAGSRASAGARGGGTPPGAPADVYPPCCAMREDWEYGVAYRLCVASGCCSRHEIGARTGANRESVRRHLKNGSITARFAAAFCRAFNINSEWLLFGEGPMRKPGQPNVQGGPTRPTRVG